MNPNPKDNSIIKSYYVYITIGRDIKYAARRFPVIAVGYTDNIDKITKMFEYRTAYEHFHPELMYYTLMQSMSLNEIEEFEKTLVSICIKYGLKRHNIDHVAAYVPDENFFSLIVDQRVKHDHYIMVLRELLERINSEPKTIENVTKEYKRLFISGFENEPYYPTLMRDLYGE